MHPLLVQGSEEAGRLYDSVHENSLDWAKLRVSTLPGEFSNPEFLRVLKNGTKEVSVSEFKLSFSRAVSSFMSVLGNRKWFAVIVEDCKDRSLYFFLLALKACPEIAKNLQGILNLPKKFQLSDFFTDYMYVCFDDMVFSGSILESSLDAVSNSPRVLVTPFVGEVARESLGNLGVNVVYSEVVRPFVKIDPSRSNTVDFKYEAYPLVFSHRTLASHDGFPEVYSKLRSAKEDFPPKDRYSRYQYLVRDIMDKFVS